MTVKVTARGAERWKQAIRGSTAATSPTSPTDAGDRLSYRSQGQFLGQRCTPQLGNQTAAAHAALSHRPAWWRNGSPQPPAAQCIEPPLARSACRRDGLPSLVIDKYGFSPLLSYYLQA